MKYIIPQHVQYVAMVFVQYVGCEYLKLIDVQRCLFECCLKSGVPLQIYLGGIMVYLRKEKQV